MEALRPVDGFRQRLEERAFAPLIKTGRGFYLLVAALLLVVGWGVFAYSTQLREGLIVTGMRDRISWGLYIAMFVFFIGISMAGTLISAILRIAKAEWRMPITRMAEFITVVALLVAPAMISLDLGQPLRMANLFIFGRWQSPLIWDVFGLTTYLVASAIYLYLALIPDLGICRDRLSAAVHPLKRWFFRLFAVEWHGTPGQHHSLARALGVVMIVIIPVAVSMHTVTSWIFAMTLREPWDSTMFGAYFVAGALYSGVGVLIILMAVIRKAFHLEEYVTTGHFMKLGYMLAAFALIVMFFNVSEYVTAGFKLRGESEMHLAQVFIGALAPYYWFYALAGMVLPVLLIAVPFTRNMWGILLAAVLANVGMWIERYLIVVGGLRVPLNPYEPANYFPSWVEWSLMAAAFALFTLLIALALKLVPAVAVWEMVEHHEAKHVTETVSESTPVAEALDGGRLPGAPLRMRPAAGPADGGQK